jgi:hypothetical protein
MVYSLDPIYHYPPIGSLQSIVGTLMRQTHPLVKIKRNCPPLRRMDLFQIWPSIKTDDSHPIFQRMCLPIMDECLFLTKYSVSPRTSHWVVAPALSTGYGGHGHGYGGRAGHSQQQVPTRRSCAFSNLLEMHA